VEHPLQELKQYTKITVEPQNTQKVTLVLDKTAFGYYDVEKKQFKVESGYYDIRIGSSSKDIRLYSSIELKQEYYY
jgi:beta-glucosidase